jgi:hypothetical protein
MYKLVIALIHIPRFPESGKRFQASGMRAIDSPHKFTPKKVIVRQKIKEFSIFASIHTLWFPVEIEFLEKVICHWTMAPWHMRLVQIAFLG